MQGTRKGDKMGRKAKCRVCGESLDTTTAFKLIEHDTNNKPKTSYYCSREEYLEDSAKKEKESEYKNKAYNLICGIIGREKIINTVLWKEWKEWNKVFSNEKIASYLEENKEYLTYTISRLEDKEFNRIRYLSAILKNSLGDFKPNVSTKEDKLVEHKIEDDTRDDIGLRINKKKKNMRRKGFAEMED